MLNSLLTSLYEYEIDINRSIQKQFQFAESVLRHLSDYLDPGSIIDMWIPLLGALSNQLLVQMATSLGLINALASVIKWCLPEYRPVWWIKENTNNSKYNLRNIKFHPYSCDTSAAFPSTHATAFTAFLLIVVWRFIAAFLPASRPVFYDKYLLIYTITSLLCASMWFSRLYFLHEFLHQCIAGSLLAASLIYLFKCYSKPLLNLNKLKACVIVTGFGLIPISAYLSMLYLDVDPFWSVRMAFKWCADPLYLKHESSPVFALCRDFGYLMGVAVSCPLAKSYGMRNINYRKRVLFLLVVEIINIIGRSYTPKQYGRFVFVAYEFLRNCFHSHVLLAVLPKFINK